MNLLNAIKKAEKATDTKAEKVGQFYFFYFNGQRLSFAINGRYHEKASVCNFKTSRIGDDDNPMIDFFSGSFHDNLTKALKHIGAK